MRTTFVAVSFRRVSRDMGLSDARGIEKEVRGVNGTLSHTTRRGARDLTFSSLSEMWSVALLLAMGCTPLDGFNACRLVAASSSGESTFRLRERERRSFLDGFSSAAAFSNRVRFRSIVVIQIAQQ